MARSQSKAKSMADQGIANPDLGDESVDNIVIKLLPKNACTLIGIG
jgi:hypothetical protein